MSAERVKHDRRTGLLVSVRNADEALAALAGGADVIDVKEPNRGPLGAADWETIADIVEVVARRAPVTAAAGELIELWPTIATKTCRPMPPGVLLVKIGLAHCGTLRAWKSKWQDSIAALRSDANSRDPQPVAVVYADWRAADAPPPEEILAAAAELGCPFILADTWDKSAGSLLDHWSLDELKHFIQRTNTIAGGVVLAGSLSGANLLAAAELRPNLVAVRGAACEGGRGGRVNWRRIEQLQQALAAAESARAGSWMPAERT